MCLMSLMAGAADGVRVSLNPKVGVNWVTAAETPNDHLHQRATVCSDPLYASGDQPGESENSLKATPGDKPQGTETSGTQSNLVNAFPVHAAVSTWQDSGVEVKAGQHVLVVPAAGDKWDPGWGPVSAKGYDFDDDPNAAVPFFHPGKEFKNWHWGSLICAVAAKQDDLNDVQNEVEISGSLGFNVDSDGEVYFLCNDNPNGGYADNSGTIHVKVVVTDSKPKASPVDLDKSSKAGSKSMISPAPTPSGPEISPTKDKSPAKN